MFKDVERVPLVFFQSCVVSKRSLPSCTEFCFCFMDVESVPCWKQRIDETAGRRHL